MPTSTVHATVNTTTQQLRGIWPVRNMAPILICEIANGWNHLTHAKCLEHWVNDFKVIKLLIICMATLAQ